MAVVISEVSQWLGGTIFYVELKLTYVGEIISSANKIRSKSRQDFKSCSEKIKKCDLFKSFKVVYIAKLYFKHVLGQVFSSAAICQWPSRPRVLGDTLCHYPYDAVRMDLVDRLKVTIYFNIKVIAQFLLCKNIFRDVHLTATLMTCSNWTGFWAMLSNWNILPTVNNFLPAQHQYCTFLARDHNFYKGRLILLQSMVHP